MTSLSIVSSWQKHQENTWQLSVLVAFRLQEMTLWFDNRSWTSSTSATCHLTEHDQVALSGFQGLAWAIWRRFMKPYTRLFEQPAPTDIRPVDKARPTILAVYYDSSSQMLCQMVQTPRHGAAPGTANTSWQYYQQGSRPHDDS
jgi:hypothetical protein